MGNFIKEIILFLFRASSILFPNSFENNQYDQLNWLDDDVNFQTFTNKFNKEYVDNDEYLYRFEVFSTNVRRIEEINKKNKLNGISWTAGINSFTDMTEEEFNSALISIKVGQDCSATRAYSKSIKSLRNELPVEVDWRLKEVITPVKRQGNCGSCWTFSTTGCLEAHYAIKTGDLLSFSEQNLIDCAGAFNNNGCNGGLPSQAFEYIHYNKGIELEEDYPYLGKDGICQFDSKKALVNVKDVFNITKGDEQGIVEAVANVGPVSIAFEVSGDFRFYAGGIYSSENCHKTSDKVNHAVLAVGYGVENGIDYWIVKNSWGEQWGDKGYFRIRRGSNECGVDQSCNMNLC